MNLTRMRTPITAAIGAGLGVARNALHREPAGFAGKVALITGGSRGLGLQLAREFAHAGCRVAICARDDDEVFNAAMGLRHEGIEAFPITCDIASRIEVEDAIQQATDHFGRVDILVNNAGITPAGPIDTMTATDFEEAMGIIFWGAVHATLAVLPQMRERKSGTIVTIISGDSGVPHSLPCETAMLAATGFSARLRVEVAKDGIQVTTIAPSLSRADHYRDAQLTGDEEGNLSRSASARTRQTRHAMSSRRRVRSSMRCVAARQSVPSSYLTTMKRLQRTTRKPPKARERRYRMLLSRRSNTSRNRSGTLSGRWRTAS